MRELIRFLLVGFVAGWVAHILARGLWRMRGCLPSISIGLAGAIGGGYLIDLAGLGDVAAVFGAAAGAFVLLSIVRSWRDA